MNKFIPNHSEIAKPLILFLTKDLAWHRKAHQANAFDKLKKLLREALVVKYFDTTKKVTMQVNASKSGLGSAFSLNKKKKR